MIDLGSDEGMGESMHGKMTPAVVPKNTGIKLLKDITARSGTLCREGQSVPGMLNYKECMCQQIINGDRSAPPTHLLPVHVEDQRLLAGCIFWAHAVSRIGIRRVSFTALPNMLATQMRIRIYLLDHPPTNP